MKFFDICLDDLPPVPRLIAELVGMEKCCQILDVYGGSRLHFPASGIPLDHPLRSFLSDDDCSLLCRFFVGTVNIPMAKSAFKAARDRSIWRDYELGMIARELARKYQLCERQIQNSVESQLTRLRTISDTAPIEIYR